MSTCISSQGEFSSHTPDDDHTCLTCGVLDEAAVLAELVELRAKKARAVAMRDEYHDIGWIRDSCVCLGCAMFDALTGRVR